MPISSAFSSISPEAQALLALATLWMSGFLMSRVSKVFGLPNVTGYILAGVVIGPYCLNILPQSITSSMSFVTDAALAMIAFGVGRYLDLEMLRTQGRRIILLTIMESLSAAFLVTLAMLTVFRMPLSSALLLGAIGSATAPASSLMTIRQYKAKGPFVNTLIQVVAMDDAVALLAFSICAAIASGREQSGNWMTMLEPVLINIGVLLVCYVLGRFLCAVLQGRSPDHRIVLTCTFIFLVAGLCAMLSVSPLLGCMMLGATYVNVTGDKSLFKQVSRITPPINILFFVLSGMRLDLVSLSSVGIIGVAYFAIRILGKYFGAWAGSRLIGAQKEIQKYLGFALIPQAGVSIGLAVLAQRILPEESGILINTIILSSSVLYEMIGPLSAKYALIKSGAIPASQLSASTSAAKSRSSGSAAAAQNSKSESRKNAALPSAAEKSRPLPAVDQKKKKVSTSDLKFSEVTEPSVSRKKADRKAERKDTGAKKETSKKNSEKKHSKKNQPTPAAPPAPVSTLTHLRQHFVRESSETARK